MNNEKLEDFMENLTAVAANTETCKSPETVWCIRISRPKKHPIKAWSAPLAQSLEQLEDHLKQGPNLTAMAEQRTVHAPDLTGDDRWHCLARSATERGIRSSLSIPLEVEGPTRAIMSLTAVATDAFSPTTSMPPRHPPSRP
ncbi:GAF domain-containing protein [Arthrobacter sp. AK04]|jgi:GAF domain-containing protein|uniref:GAF domain-containing protein n=1 Tax=Arthrobacter sp. AK04 TaxID=2900048 RepID=UPI001E47E8A5|nr:GAF domain-containing protein [Arthrobacter sp. AK04]MCD5343460.1 GAF domain-containing protein [Arthrobacter sp. AK04]